MFFRSFGLSLPDIVERALNSVPSNNSKPGREGFNLEDTEPILMAMNVWRSEVG